MRYRVGVIAIGCVCVLGSWTVAEDAIQVQIIPVPAAAPAQPAEAPAPERDPEIPEPIEKELPTPATLVYQQDFDGEIGEEWSNRQIVEAPIAKTKMLGKLSNESVSLSLKDLPQHTWITIQLDFAMINTWDGSRSSNYGPDIWTLRVEDGPLLTRTTFAHQKRMTQSYPGRYPIAQAVGGAGAAEFNALGMKMRSGNAVSDATYPIQYTFRHTGQKLKFIMEAEGLQELEDESWGIDNVKVYTHVERSIKPMGRQQLEAAWRSLVGEDGIACEVALHQLADQGDGVLGFLYEKLGVDEVLNQPQRIAQLIDQLDDDSYHVRQAATEKLIVLDALAKPKVKAALESEGLSLEATWRARHILSTRQQVERKLSQTDRARMQAIWVMDLINTPKAREALKQVGVNDL